MKRQWLGFLLKAGISAALLVFLFKRMDGVELAERLGQVDASLLILGYLAFISTLLLQALRLCGVASLVAPLRYLPALAITWIGFAFGQILPSQVGGDPFRVWYLGKQNIRLREGFMIVLADRVFGFIALFILLAAGLPWLFSLTNEPLLRLFAVLLVLAGLAAWLAAAWFDNLANGLMSSSWLRFVPSWLVEASAFLRRTTFSLIPAIRGFGISLLANMGQAATAWLLACGLGVEIGFFALLILMPLVNLATFLPVSIAGWGLREAVLVPALALLGLEPGAALAFSVLIGLVQLAAGLPGLGIWLTLRR